MILQSQRFPLSRAEDRGAAQAAGQGQYRKTPPGKWPESHDFQIGLAWLYFQRVSGKEVNPLAWDDFTLLEH